MFDRTVSGSPLKWLSVVDYYTRECLALKVDRGITSENVIDTLSELFAMRWCAHTKKTRRARRRAALR